jgi:uncharacterized membrane protein YebE (DUF533 family)
MPTHSPKKSDGSSKKTSNTGAKIAGSVIGALAGVAIGAMAYIYYKSIRMNKPLSKTEDDIEDNDL